MKAKIPKFVYTFAISPVTSWFAKKKTQFQYYKNVGKAFQTPAGGLINIENSSGGFLCELVDLAIRYAPNSKRCSWIVVNEPHGSDLAIKEHIKSSYPWYEFDVVDLFETKQSVTFSSQVSSYDFCDRDFKPSFEEQYDVSVHQALLEHVIDPVQTLISISKFMKPGGIIALQTCNVFMAEHRYPIDTLRFFPDFFIEQYEITKLKCLEVKNSGPSIYAVLQKEPF